MTTIRPVAPLTAAQKASKDSVCTSLSDLPAETGHIVSDSARDTSFQGIIATLTAFWAQRGCVILQPYDLEMGAGTSHPFTALYALGQQPWRTAYVQPCRRPGDGRYGENPNRLQRYYQFQVFLKPAPDCPQDWLLESYRALGLDTSRADIRFVEDDWENPSLGAAGMGWEVWMNGMEVTQFTYFQQMGGVSCDPVSVELTYGLERIAMALQNKESTFALDWNPPGQSGSVTYADVALAGEKQFCAWYFEHTPIDVLQRSFAQALQQGHDLVQKNLPLPAYDQCIQANHLFNMLNARGAISVTQRAGVIAQIRTLASACCIAYAQRSTQSVPS